MTKSMIDMTVRPQNQRTTFPHDSPQVPVLRYTQNCMQHGACVGVANSYVMYMHNMPRDTQQGRRPEQGHRVQIYGTGASPLLL